MTLLVKVPGKDCDQGSDRDFIDRKSYMENTRESDFIQIKNFCPSTDMLRGERDTPPMGTRCRPGSGLGKGVSRPHTGDSQPP